MHAKAEETKRKSSKRSSYRHIDTAFICRAAAAAGRAEQDLNILVFLSPVHLLAPPKHTAFNCGVLLRPHVVFPTKPEFALYT